MDCHRFEVLMESLLDGDLEATEQAACLQHAEQCPACGELLNAVGYGGSQVATESVEPLVDAILERTIGSVCGQAEEKLPEYVDHDLAAADRELLQLHLTSCSQCRKLVTTLGLLNRDLPRLAEVPVDELFTQQVLMVTLPRKTRIKRWWRQRSATLVQRPRFAMEAAYAGLLVVMLVLGAFSTPLAALPQKGLELVQAEPSAPSVWTQTGESLGTFWEWVASLIETAEEKPESTEEQP